MLIELWISQGKFFTIQKNPWNEKKRSVGGIAILADVVIELANALGRNNL